MNDIDELLSIIENPTRRRILEYLTREPSYPLQLSKELGISQQAIMKNLALMEQTGLLMSYSEESSMGPKRTVYVPNQQFTLMIDLHDNMFSARLISKGGIEENTEKMVDIETAYERLKDLDYRIDELDRERAELLNERNSVMNAINCYIHSVEDPARRKELYRDLDEMINENKEA